MFLVGLDFVGDKLMEVDVFSPRRPGPPAPLRNQTSPRPSSLASNARLTLHQNYGPALDNRRLATL
jgi:hypothetical protein